MSVFDPHAVRLFIGTPNSGLVRDEYMDSVVATREFLGARGVQVVRKSSKMPRTVPEKRAELLTKCIEGDFTHLLYVDADMQFLPQTVFLLLTLDLPVVGCTYAGRHGAPGEPASLVVKFLPGEKEARGCLKVAALGMGLTLIKRDVLQTMEGHYGSANACFHEPLVEHQIEGEDFAFFRRWREIGGHVHCMLDAPITHHVGGAIFANAKEVLMKAQAERAAKAEKR